MLLAQRSYVLLGEQAGLSERFLVQVGRLGDALADPSVHDPDSVGDQLYPVEPHLEVAVVTQRVDLSLRALNKEEAAQLSRLGLEDDDVEPFDQLILREPCEVSP